MQSQLITLQGRYTDDYPDVVKTKKDIAELQKKLKEINAAAANAPASTGSRQANLSEPPEIQQLRLQIHQYQQVITQATRDQQRLQEQIKIYQGRVALSPAVEEQYRKLTRDYDAAQKFYDDTSKQEKDSETQTAMEREQQGEQMQLQIPADLPESPTFPNRLHFCRRRAGRRTGPRLGSGHVAGTARSVGAYRTRCDGRARIAGAYAGSLGGSRGVRRKMETASENLASDPNRHPKARKTRKKEETVEV